MPDIFHKRKKSEALLKRLKRVECPDTTFVNETFPIVFKKAKGARVTDVDGQHYLDMTSCFGVLALGHRPPAALRAIRKQSAQMIHGMGDVHPTRAKIEFLEALCHLLPYEDPRVILSCSGGEAVESAMKTALLVTKRSRFVGFTGAYHGLQFGALQLTHRNHFKEHFRSWDSPHVDWLPFPTDPEMHRNNPLLCGAPLDAASRMRAEENLVSPEEALALMEDTLRKRECAAVVAEPLQGRAGEREYPRGFWKAAQEICRRTGTLIIFDEIFTGMGRTGEWLASTHHGILPDLTCLGKVIGGGLPLSACVGNIVGNWPESEGEARHTSTFLGHPLACAAGKETLLELYRQFPDLKASLPIWESELENFCRRCRERELSPERAFEIRGRGWMRGFWFFNAEPGYAAKLSDRLLSRGFITLPSGQDGRVLAFTPPLNLSPADLRKFLKALEEEIAENAEGSVDS